MKICFSEDKKEMLIYIKMGGCIGIYKALKEHLFDGADFKTMSFVLKEEKFRTICGARVRKSIKIGYLYEKLPNLYGWANDEKTIKNIDRLFRNILTDIGSNGYTIATRDKSGNIIRIEKNTVESNIVVIRNTYYVAICFTVIDKR